MSAPRPGRTGRSALRRANFAAKAMIILAALTTPIFLGAIDANGQALLHHQAPPHIVTITLFLFFFPSPLPASLRQ